MGAGMGVGGARTAGWLVTTNKPECDNSPTLLQIGSSTHLTLTAPSHYEVASLLTTPTSLV